MKPYLNFCIFLHYTNYKYHCKNKNRYYEIMHRCDIKYLYEGTNELVNKYKKYLTCSSCNNSENYCDENFIYCKYCNNYFCNECEYEDLVYTIYNYNVCSCDNYKHTTCDSGHFFCNSCKLSDCHECKKEDL